MKVVVTSPDYDEVTHYLYHYTKEIIDVAHKEGISLSCLSRPRLTRDHFSKLIIKNSPLLILLNGHGKEKKHLFFRSFYTITETAKYIY